jgi:predicted Zn-dependent protease with MMP-like domain/HEPN domain-containing protein
MPVHLSRKEFERLAREALASLPEEFRAYTGGMEIRVEDYPDDASMVEWGAKPPHYPFGCYDGPSLGEVDGTRREFAGVMTLFKRPLEEWCQSEEELIDQIERTVFHELGHRFGFEEEDMPAAVQGGAGFDVPGDMEAEARRRMAQARADLMAAKALLEGGHADWALMAALSAVSLGLQAFLLGKGVEPGEFSTSSLTHLVLRCEEFDGAFAAFREVDGFEQISTDLGEEGVPPPCSRVSAKDARDAAALAERVVKAASGE